jgi:putative membrane protein
MSGHPTLRRDESVATALTLVDPSLWVDPRAWDWRLDVSAVLLACGALYTRGWVRLHRRGHGRLATTARLLACLGSLAVLAIALMSPIDTLQSQFFLAHMVQHLLLMFLAAPLALAGWPLPFVLWGLPGVLRRYTGRLLVRRGPLRRALAAVTPPAVAFGSSTALLWGWHVPTAYNAALEIGWVHDLEHVSFFAAFLVFWWRVVGSPPAPAPLGSNAARLGYLLAGATQSSLLGGLITLSDRVLYTYYLSVPRADGLSPLVDQQIGGAIMWFAGAPVYIVAAAWTLREEP